MGQKSDELGEPRPYDRGEPQDGLPIEFEKVESGDGDEEVEITAVEIERTRAGMSETIDAIQEKLSPRHLKEEARDLASEAAEAVREATIGRVEHMASNATSAVKQSGTSFWDTLKANPIPAAIAGISLGWLIMKSRSNRASYRAYESSYGYGIEDLDGDYPRRPDDGRSRGVGQRAGAMAGQATDTVKDAASGVAQGAKDAAGTVAGAASSAAGTVADKAGNVAGTVADTAGTVADKAGHLAEQARDATGSALYRGSQRVQDFPSQVEQWVQSNPLAMAGAAVALGAAAGLILPETDGERKLMGETRERFMEQTRGVIDETKEKIQHIAEEAQTAAKDEAKAQNLTGTGEGRSPNLTV